MKAFPSVPCLFSVIFLLVSCKEPAAEAEVTSTRTLTTADESPAIGASDAEQFLPPEVRSQIEGQDKPDIDRKWDYNLPDGWRKADKRRMREVNLTFGPAEAPGQVYLTVVGGKVEANADRWFRQFGKEPEPLADLKKVPFMGDEAVFIETQGRYEPGMGKEPQPNQALFGVLAQRDGRIVTVKMVGPKKTVLAERVHFLKFVASLKRG
jgi:hypothetical protein